MESIEAVQAGIYSGLIDKNSISLEQYRPRLLINDVTKGQKVLTSLIGELRQCDAFFFSVAFITESGVVSLLNTLIELEKKNIKGKIIASRYLEFTQPKALRRLLAFNNIDLRIVTTGNHHTKGYIFRRNDVYSLIVGSSNMTQSALSSNKEWNLKVTSMENGSLIHETLGEFDSLFQSAVCVDSQWIDQYEEIYLQNLINQNFQKQSKPTVLLKVADHNSTFQVDHQPLETDHATLQLDQVMPNKMQVKALAGIQQIRNEDEHKALLISATGTGKTYLAAFDVKKVRPGRLLFLAHREQLLNQAIESFERVLGAQIKCGKLSVSSHQHDCQYLFSTVQTISKTPMALSDDRSFNKDTIRRYTVEGTRVIPGASTINFDEISRNKIYEAIDQVNFRSVKYLRESYTNLKYRLGRIPKLMDFEYHDSMDLEVLFSGTIGSYHEFLKKYEPEYKLEFNELQAEILLFVSKKFAVGKRPHELLVLKSILAGFPNPLKQMEIDLYELLDELSFVVNRTYKKIDNCRYTILEQAELEQLTH